MPLRGAHFPPRSRDVAIGILNRVEKISDHPAHFLHRHVLGMAEHAGLAGKTYIERLGPDVLAKLQVLVESHAVRAPIIPGSPDFLPLLERPHRLLPVIRGLNRPPFDHAPAGKAGEPRFQVRQHLRQIWPEPIRPALERFRREERHQVEPDLAFGARRQDKPGLRFAFCGFQCGAELLPAPRDAGDLHRLAAQGTVARFQRRR